MIHPSIHPSLSSCVQGAVAAAPPAWRLARTATSISHPSFLSLLPAAMWWLINLNVLVLPPSLPPSLAPTPHTYSFHSSLSSTPGSCPMTHPFLTPTFHPSVGPVPPLLAPSWSPRPSGYRCPPAFPVAPPPLLLLPQVSAQMLQPSFHSIYLLNWWVFFSPLYLWWKIFPLLTWFSLLLAQVLRFKAPAAPPPLLETHKRNISGYKSIDGVTVWGCSRVPVTLPRWGDDRCQSMAAAEQCVYNSSCSVGVTALISSLETKRCSRWKSWFKAAWKVYMYHLFHLYHEVLLQMKVSSCLSWLAGVFYFPKRHWGANIKDLIRLQ